MTETPSVLILGGGGFFGAALAREWHDQGWRLAVSVRHDRPRPNLDGVTAERLVGDDMAPGCLERWIAGRALVIDAAAPYALNLHDPHASHDDRLCKAQARTARILSAAQAAGAPVIHIGSLLTAQAQPQGRRDRLIAAAHPYFRMKVLLERQVREAARRGQPVLIVNPASFLGPGNLRPPNHAFVAAVMSGTMPFSYPDVINVMDLRDAARMVRRASEEGLFGAALALSGWNISVHALTDRIVALSGARRPPRGRALAAGAAVLYMAEVSLAVLGREARHPSLPVLLTLASRSVEPGAMQRSLGVPLRSLDETLADEIAWFRARGVPVAV